MLAIPFSASPSNAKTPPVSTANGDVMAVSWGDFQAIIQLSAGLNVAILSFVDISIPAIKERRRVFSKGQ